MSNWLTGAIILAGLLLASDVVFGWRNATPLFRQGISYGDMEYLTGFFGTWLIGDYVTALVSRRGLMKAMAADRKSAPALSRPRQTSGQQTVPPGGSDFHSVTKFAPFFTSFRGLLCQRCLLFLSTVR